MKPPDRPKRSQLRAVADVLDVAAAAAGHPEASPRQWGSVIVMMIVAMVGVVVWFGAFILSGVIIAVFGLGHGPYASLGGAIALAGFVGGLAAAGIVMLRIIRRHRRLVALSGFGNERDDDATTPVVTEATRHGISPTELRDLDARLVERTDQDPART